jgi:hypothetical protein
MKFALKIIQLHNTYTLLQAENHRNSFSCQTFATQYKTTIDLFLCFSLIDSGFQQLKWLESGLAIGGGSVIIMI